MGLGIPPATIGLLCFANLSELLFSLALLVDWIRSWRHVKVYWAYGLAAGLGVLGFGILHIIAAAFTTLPALSQFVPPGWEGGAPTDWEWEVLGVVLFALLLIAFGLLAAFITVTKVAGYTMLGMHYADVLGHPSFPLLQRLRGARPPAATDEAWPAAGGSLEMATSAATEMALPEGKSLLTAAPAGKRRPWRGYALSTLGVAAAAAAYSVLLFRLTSPHISQVFTGLPGYTLEMGRVVTPAVLVTILAAAFSEELTYRLGIQGFLARYLNAQGSRYWLPVVLSALLWTVQHAGAIEPGWVKLAQIFPIGLMLGWLYRRHGVEGCILAHALFNLGLAPFVSFLISP